MSQNTISQNETSNMRSSPGNSTGVINSDNGIAAQRISQNGVGLFNPLALQRQHQQQVTVNGMIGNANANIANIQGGTIASNMNSISAINNMNGMVNNGNATNGNSNFNAQHSIQANMNPNVMNSNANLNNFNVNDFMRLQQQLQHQQLQQQMQQQQQMQMQMQQLQGVSGLNNTNSQNMNYALMAAQQNQNQHSNNASNNNILQSFIGRNPQFSGGLPVHSQPNALQNPFIGQLMVNQQQNGIGTMVGQNNGVIGGTNSFQLPSPNSLFSRDASRRMRGGVIEPFPEKLHRLLLEVEAAGRADVISFVANGRAFAIHKADNFFKEIVPLYFRQSRLSSFKRQLNLYGFELINTGPARGGYYHEMFVKERPELCRRMRRIAVKVAPSKDGNGKKKSKNKAHIIDDPSILGSSPVAIKIEDEETAKDATIEEESDKIVGDAEEQPVKGSIKVPIEQTSNETEVAGEKSDEENAEHITKTASK